MASRGAHVAHVAHVAHTVVKVNPRNNRSPKQNTRDQRDPHDQRDSREPRDQRNKSTKHLVYNDELVMVASRNGKWSIADHKLMNLYRSWKDTKQPATSKTLDGRVYQVSMENNDLVFSITTPNASGVSAKPSVIKKSMLVLTMGQPKFCGTNDDSEGDTP
jgi:hypothetical protein